MILNLLRGLASKLIPKKKEEKPKTAQPRQSLSQLVQNIKPPSPLVQQQFRPISSQLIRPVGIQPELTTLSRSILRNFAEQANTIPSRQNIASNISQKRKELARANRETSLGFIGPPSKGGSGIRNFLGNMVSLSPNPETLPQFLQSTVVAPVKGAVNTSTSILENVGKLSGSYIKGQTDSFNFPGISQISGVARMIQDAPSVFKSTKETPTIPKFDIKKGEGLGAALGSLAPYIAAGSATQSAFPLIGRGFQLTGRARQAAVATGAEIGTQALAGDTENIVGDTALSTVANMLFPARTGVLKQLRNVPTETPMPTATQAVPTGPTGDETASLADFFVGPRKEYEQLVKKAQKLDEKIARGSRKELFVPAESRTKDILRGQESIVGKLQIESGFAQLAEASAKRSGKAIDYEEAYNKIMSKVPTEQVRVVEDFMNLMPRTLFDDVGLSIRQNSPKGQLGEFNYATDTITLFRDNITQTGGEFDRTFIHEAWHNLAKYLPEDMIKNFVRDYENAIKKSGWADKVYDSKTKSIKTELSVKKFDELSKANPIFKEKYRPVKNDREQITGYTYAGPREDYRLVKLDEWLAENMMETSAKKLSQLSESSRSIIVHMKEVFRAMIEAIQKAFGYKHAEKVLDNFMKGRYTEMQRRGGLMTESKTSNLKRPLNENDLIEVIANPEKTPGIGLETYLFSQPVRVWEKAFGKKGAKLIDDFIMKPKDQAVSAGVDLTKKITTELKDLIKKFDLKGEKRAAVQRYGEKLDTKEDLLKKFTSKEVDQIIEADKWFRSNYDNFIEAINSMKRALGEEPVKKRADYYRHMGEFSSHSGVDWKETIKSRNWKDILKDISSGKIFRSGEGMATKSFEKARTGAKTKYDAVEGFMDVLPQYVDYLVFAPSVQRIKELRKALAKTATDSNNAQYKLLDEWLKKYSQKLGGQDTNSIITKAIKSSPLGEAVFKLDNMTAGSKIAGSIRTAFSSIYNIPLFSSLLGVRGGAKAFKRLAKDLVSGNDLSNFQKNSSFIKERYSYRLERGLKDTTLGKAGEKLDTAMTEIISIPDELMLRAFGELKYRELIEKGLSESDAIFETDKFLKKGIASRQKGDIPRFQDDDTVKLFSRFQVEVANQMDTILKDFFDGSDIPTSMERIAIFLASAYLVNEITEDTLGVRVLPDGIDFIASTIDELNEPSDQPFWKRVLGAGLGEITTLIPFGSIIDAFIPDDFKRQFFDQEGRFKPSLGIVKVAADFLSGKAGIIDTILSITKGGGQIKKALDTVEAGMNEGDILSSRGEKIGELETPSDYIKSATLGPTTVQSAQEFFSPTKDPIEKERSRASKEVSLRKKEIDKIATKWDDLSKEELIEQTKSLSKQDKEYLAAQVKKRMTESNYKKYKKLEGAELQEFLSTIPKLLQDDLLDRVLIGDSSKLKNSSNEVKGQFLYRQFNSLDQEEFAKLTKDLYQRKIISDDAVNIAIQLISNQ